MMVFFLKWENSSLSFPFSISSLLLCVFVSVQWLWNGLNAWKTVIWFEREGQKWNKVLLKEGMTRVGMNRWDKHKNKRMRTGDGEKRRNVMIVVERMIDEKGLRNDSLKRTGWRNKGMNGGKDGCSVVLMWKWEREWIEKCVELNQLWREQEKWDDWNEVDGLMMKWGKCSICCEDGWSDVVNKHTEKEKDSTWMGDEWFVSVDWTDSGGRVCVCVDWKWNEKGVEDGMWEIEEWRVFVCEWI